MPLIASVSGIRGTIGGKPGKGLTPDDVVAFCSSYADRLKKHQMWPRVVIGRDGRISGLSIATLVKEVMVAHGIEVIDIGLATTPTTAMAVPYLGAHGGIIITASHNPQEWNALKLLDANGEFLSPTEGEHVVRAARNHHYEYVPLEQWGTSYRKDSAALEHHISSILQHPLVRIENIRKQRFHVILDAINSVGSIALPPLLEALGVSVEVINSEVTGKFAHTPEPLPEHLQELSNRVRATKAVLGLAVDPDADRLVLVDENGEFPGEEYTLVMVADYVLRHAPGPTVSNTASTSALREISRRHGQPHYESAVGEWHVVQKMKEVNATIGGEGNGGIIDPRLHYGRDALIGTALILSHLAQTNETLSAWRSRMPDFFMSKEKIPLQSPGQADELIEALRAAFSKSYPISELDGLKIYFDQGWVLLRKSNTEPIIRIIAEATTPKALEQYLLLIQQTLTIKQ